MRQLSCDTGVWKNVFKKIWEVIQVKDTEKFNEGTLKRMVEFCTQAKVGPEMRSEVVKVAAGMIELPGPERPEIKIRLAIQSWGSPETLEVNGNRLEELTKVEEKLGTKATILAIEARSGPVADMNIFLMSDRVSQNLGELTLVLSNVNLCPRVGLGDGQWVVDEDLIKAYVSLLKGSRKWMIGTLILDDNRDTWAALARIADTGYILELGISTAVGGTWLRGVSQEDIRNLWEASHHVAIDVGLWSELYRGGKLNNSEGHWQLMMQFLGRDV